jgi:hypothetical protein
VITHYSVLYFKEAFFFIPLYPDSQRLLAFEDPSEKQAKSLGPFFPRGLGTATSVWIGSTSGPSGMGLSATFLVHSVDVLLLCEPLEDTTS